MKYTQIVLTDFQAGLAASALSNAAADAVDEREKEQCSQLADFLFAVADNSTAFPIKTPAMARAIRKRVARLKGPAAPKRANARKRAQERAQGGQKRTRAQKREEAVAHNEAFFKAMEEARLEAEKLAEVNDEPKKLIRVPWRKQ